MQTTSNRHVRRYGPAHHRSRVSIGVKTQRLTILYTPIAAATFAQAPKSSTVTEKSVRSYMNVLASDEMRGRGSATADELAAAKYIASQLKLLKIEPAGDHGNYLQTVKFSRRPRGAAPDAPPVEATTTNCLGILHGSDPKLSKETILLSAQPQSSK